MAAYHLVHDSRFLQTDCQEPASAPEPDARQSSIGYLYVYLFTVSLLIDCRLMRLMVDRTSWQTRQPRTARTTRLDWVLGSRRTTRRHWLDGTPRQPAGPARTTRPARSAGIPRPARVHGRQWATRISRLARTTGTEGPTRAEWVTGPRRQQRTTGVAWWYWT